MRHEGLLFTTAEVAADGVPSACRPEAERQAGIRVCSGEPPRTTLFCIPHAGGSVTYYTHLKRFLPDHIVFHPLEMAGRGRRSREPLARSMDSIREDLFARIAPIAQNSPYTLFGHSMGALLALLCALQARTVGVPLPKAIFVSACAPPNAVQNTLPSPVSALSSTQVWQYVEKLGGIPPCIAASAEFCSYLEPILHADFTALNTWRPEPASPLPIPITVFLGDQDAVDEYRAREWQEYTTLDVCVHSFPGNHFYVQDHWETLAARMTQTIARLTDDL